MTHDSRSVGERGMYACLRGAHHDGHAFAAAAVAAGAGVAARRPPARPAQVGADVNQLVVDDTRRGARPGRRRGARRPADGAAPSSASPAPTARPPRRDLLAAILRAAGDRPASSARCRARTPRPRRPSCRRRLAAMRADGDRAVVMEVSSHALALHRVDGTRFDAAVFTNLGARSPRPARHHRGVLRGQGEPVQPELAAVGVVNVDDPTAAARRRRADRDGAVLDGRRPRTRGRGGVGGLHLAVAVARPDVRLAAPLGGSFNVDELAGRGDHRGRTRRRHSTTSSRGLAAAEPVPGRFERVAPRAVGTADAIDVIVDYAHTPDGLEEVIAAGGAVVGAGGRVIVVFGAGGDRDREKRPRDGRRRRPARRRGGDHQRQPPFRGAGGDRRARSGRRRRRRSRPRRGASSTAPRRSASPSTLAEPGDMVIIAGKGHETHADHRRPGASRFDDRVVARDVLASGSLR